jgi:hypothetical protein
MASSSIYRRLNADDMEIRVLRVQGDTREARLDCQLETISLLREPIPPYEAISYRWGAGTDTDTILVNGLRVEVPASAVRVLRVFRPNEGVRTLWIDAICINQADLHERNEQVSIMHHIYGDCKVTLIWLGNTDEIVERAFRIIRAICRTSRRQRLSHDCAILPSGMLSSDLDNVVDLLRRPWFRRVWVLQEAVLAPKADCYIGERSLPWEDICYVGRWIPTILSQHFPSYEYDADDALNGFHMCILGEMIGDGEPVLMTNGGVGNVKQRVALAALLESTRGLQASDLRDKCYAVRGIPWVLPKKEDIFPDWASVDYNKEISRVCRDITRMAVMQTNRLYALESIDGRPLEHRLLEEDGFASWVPRWDTTSVALTTETFAAADFRSRVLECNNGTADFKLINEYGETAFLPLKGYVLDEVVRTGEILDAGPDTCTNEQAYYFMQNAVMLSLKASGNAHDDAWGWVINALDAVSVGAVTEWLPEKLDRERLSDFVTDISLDSSKKLRLAPDTDGKILEVFEDLLDVVRRFGAGRQLFLTRESRVGIGPMGTQAGDHIVAAFGGRYPFVLRPQSSPISAETTQRLQCRLVGICYVQDFMHGEAVEAFEMSGVQPTLFEVW